MKWVIGGLIVAGGLFLAGLSAQPASAGILNFNLGSCAQVTEPCTLNTDTGLSVLDFVNGPFDLRTSGAIGASPANLFVKNTGVGDVGLGLFLGPQNEIGPGETVTLDLSKLAAAGFSSGTVTIESLDTGEIGVVTDAVGPHIVTEVGSSLTNEVPVSFSVVAPDVEISAINGSVLAAADLEVSVPEAPTGVLLVTGLLGLSLVGVLRRFAARTA